VPVLADRPLSVVRVLRGQAPFMQKNLPAYAPDWLPSTTLWAESSRRNVSYAVCNDRRTLLWFANQRAVEYHPTLYRLADVSAPTHLVLDIDPPEGASFEVVIQAAHLVHQTLLEAGLDGLVKTSGAKGVHVLVPIAGADTEQVAAATRALAARAERRDPGLATTAFVRADRDGKVFLDSTRAGGATIAAAYSPRLRAGVPVSYPVAWDVLDRVTPTDFTLHTVAALAGVSDPWTELMPSPRHLDPDLVEEGRRIPIARVQAMHEGKRRARARRTSPSPDQAGQGE
jgi:DNA ligase D-like protein (predicted polymerase)